MIGCPAREAHGGDHLVWLDRRGHVSHWEFGERQFALAVRPDDDHGRIIAGSKRNELGRRIEMAERAADCAAVAGLPMSDLQQRLVHDWKLRAQDVGELQITLPRHGADLDRTVVLADVGEPLDEVEVDDVIGQHEAHVEHGHQRLSAGKQLGIFQAAQQLDRLSDGFRVVVAKGWGFHMG